MFAVWLRMVREKGLRRGIAESLRWVADRITGEDAFVGGGMTMQLARGIGWVIDHEGLRGVPLWYRASDYEKYMDEQ